MLTETVPIVIRTRRQRRCSHVARWYALTCFPVWRDVAEKNAGHSQALDGPIDRSTQNGLLMRLPCAQVREQLDWDTNSK